MDFFQRGSLLQGTIESGCTEVRTRLEVESDEPDDRLLMVIRGAKRGCFAENMVRKAVPLIDSVLINGKPVEL